MKSILTCPRHDSGDQAWPTQVSGLVGPAADEPLELADDADRSDTEPPDEEVQEVDSPRTQSAYQANPADRRLPVLAPHRAWQPHHVPDIHSALPWAIVEGIVDIVTR